MESKETKQRKKERKTERKKTDLTYLKIGHVNTPKNNFYY